MAIEREIKLIAGVDFEMPDVTGGYPGLARGAVEHLHLDAVYYDTPTLALARAGVTLRSRTGEAAPIWTLKLDSTNDSGELARTELTFDEPLGPIPHDARLATRAHVRSQTLGPVLRLHTDRTQIHLELDGEPFLKLSDDKVVADAGTEPGTSFREIELELSSDPPDARAVEHVLGVIRAAGARQEDPLPKAFRALGDRALGPPDVEVIAVDKRATTGELVRHVIAKSVAQLVDHHPGVWLGEDPEHVHRFRVATRRLRSDLRTFEPMLDRHWTTWLRDELKWLGAQVGMGRDADVLAARLRSQMTSLPADDQVGIDCLRTRLTENSSDARQHVVAALSSDRYTELLDALVEAARQPRFAVEPPGLAQSRARTVVTRLVRRPWRKLKRAADALADDSPDPAFHAVRIRAKRVRYAAEAVEPVCGRNARRFAEAVERVQTVLGDHQDTAVAEAWLRDAAAAEPAAHLVIGELVTMERLERLRLRGEFASVWKKASRRKLRAWFR
ncbi:MAG TPA: CYTH and CHAD domain-containing protein [Ilumatobacteraceae bacterium]|nr:CYTH and CHAD domain-containing protein [Ilumatobacteraceae bacterium]